MTSLSHQGAATVQHWVSEQVLRGSSVVILAQVLLFWTVVWDLSLSLTPR